MFVRSLVRGCIAVVGGCNIGNGNSGNGFRKHLGVTCADALGSSSLFNFFYRFRSVESIEVTAMRFKVGDLVWVWGIGNSSTYGKHAGVVTDVFPQGILTPTLSVAYYWVTVDNCASNHIDGKWAACDRMLTPRGDSKYDGDAISNWDLIPWWTPKVKEHV